jgi:hypothetical protein
MEVTYELIQPILPPPDMKAAGWNSALPAGVKLGKWIAVSANEQSLKWRIDRELAHMVPELKKARGSKQGVLVVAQTKEWEREDPTGTRSKTLHEILIGPAGNDSGEAYRIYVMSPRMHGGAGKGWRLAPKYMWVTAP